ncbi:MAG TPA: DNA methyltransferase, partial [Opitutus sp.]|nr:DNA methyltransferase [Opitutus sp.]
IAAQGFVLTPGRFVGAADVVDDGEVFEEVFARLKSKLDAQTTEGRRLDDEIARQLRRLG